MNTQDGESLCHRFKAYGVVEGACGVCVVGLLCWSYVIHTICYHHRWYEIGCDTAWVAVITMKVTTIRMSAAPLGITHAAWNHVLTHFTAIFTVFGKKPTNSGHMIAEHTVVLDHAPATDTTEPGAARTTEPGAASSTEPGGEISSAVSAATGTEKEEALLAALADAWKQSSRRKVQAPPKFFFFLVGPFPKI